MEDPPMFEEERLVDEPNHSGDVTFSGEFETLPPEGDIGQAANEDIAAEFVEKTEIPEEAPLNDFIAEESGNQELNLNDNFDNLDEGQSFENVEEVQQQQEEIEKIQEIQAEQEQNRAEMTQKRAEIKKVMEKIAEEEQKLAPEEAQPVEETVETLRQRLQSRDAHISKISNTNSVLKNKLLELNSVIDKQLNAKGMSVASSKNIIKKSSVKDQEMKNLNKQLEIYKRTISDLNKKLNRSNKPERVVDLENQVSEKNNKIKEMQNEIKGLLNQVREQSRFLEKNDERDTEKLGEIANNEIKALKNSNLKLRKETSDLRVQVTKQKEDNLKLQAKLKKTTDIYQNVAPESLSELEPLKAENADLKDKLSKAEKAIEAEKESKIVFEKKYKYAVQKLQDKIEELETELDQKAEEIEKFQTENSILKHQGKTGAASAPKPKVKSADSKDKPVVPAASATSEVPPKPEAAGTTKKAKSSNNNSPAVTGPIPQQQSAAAVAAAAVKSQAQKKLGPKKTTKSRKPKDPAVAAAVAEVMKHSSVPADDKKKSANAAFDDAGNNQQTSDQSMEQSLEQPMEGNDVKFDENDFEAPAEGDTSNNIAPNDDFNAIENQEAQPPVQESSDEFKPF